MINKRRQQRTQNRLAVFIDANNVEHKYLGHDCKVIQNKDGNIEILDLTVGRTLNQKYTRKFIGHVRAESRL